MLQSAMPVMSRALVPEVLPAVMPDVPAVPEMLPAPPPALALPAWLPADLPYAEHACWDEGECARLLRFPDAAGDPRRPRGREYPLSYLLALPLVAGMAGDGELDAAGEWIASAPEEVLLRLGAPRDRSGRARRPDATTIGRILGRVDQCQYDDALCSWTAARARAQHPGLRKHLRVDGKALRGAAPRGGRAPMLMSGIWDDGTTAAQRPVNVAKTNEIPDRRLNRESREEPPERRKQCVNVSLVFPPVYNLNPVACALDIDSACSAGCDYDLLAPRAHTHLRPGLNLPGFRVRSADAKPALRYCFHAGLKNLIHSCGKVHAVLIACAHFSSIHAHSGLTARSARNMISDHASAGAGHVTRNAGTSPSTCGALRHGAGSPAPCPSTQSAAGSAALFLAGPGTRMTTDALAAITTAAG